MMVAGRRGGNPRLVPESAEPPPVPVSALPSQRRRAARRGLDGRSPFVIGLTGAAGVAIMVLLADVVITAKNTLVLIGLALFIAIGLDPAVTWLAHRRLPRWAAVVVVCLTGIGAVGGFLAVAIPQLATQAVAFVQQAPAFVQELGDKNSTIGALNAQFHIVDGVTQALSGGATALVGGLLGAGVAVLGAAADTVIVIVLVIYFLAGLPRIRNGLYRLFPHSRRPRAMELGDEIFAKVGAYVLGIILLALIAGTTSLFWMLIIGIPYPLLLAIMVTLLDVVPVVGTSVAGVVVTLVALSVSGPAAIATAVFFVAYRLVEDYLLVPRVIGRAVQVPALLTIVSLLLGAVLLGVVGAVVAIPVAASLQLVVQQVVLPRLDRA
jgi:predicted PurR-regulated permease PerM